MITTDEEIGIGILDIYSQIDLDNLLSSIPEKLKKNIFVVSNSNNKSVFKTEKFSKKHPLAFLRNKILANFRLQNKKFLFILESNIVFSKEDYIDRVIKTAKVFGTWIITAPEKNSIIIEDDIENVSLHLTPFLDTSFLFLFNGVVSNIGYFNEQYIAGKGVEVLDYINRCRKKGIYPPNNYNPTVKEGIIKNTINFEEERGSESEKKIKLTLGLFHHLYNYIPGHSDPVSVSQDVLLSDLEKIQNNYSMLIKN